jgi:predicted ATP-grasp superfamily ATP-dependent carboligase
MLTFFQIVGEGDASLGVKIHGNKKLVVFTSNQVFSPEIENDIISAVLDFGLRHQCKLILSLKALRTNPNLKKNKYNLKLHREMDLEDEPNTKEDLLQLIKESKSIQENLWFCTNNSDFADTLLQLKHEPLRNVCVDGVSGGILAASCSADIPICCLFTSFREIYKFISIDAYSAISFMICISKLLKEDFIEIDVNQFEKNLEEIENSMIQIVEGMNQFSTKYNIKDEKSL